mmetsp:Transcript_92247/g.145850  ORF Transcript_92247/g.145850 Transcript_92247/m.145850 type:complete len:249 (+) Transcript_92247:71-817(+)
MGAGQCKDVGILCGCMSGDPAEVQTEVPVYGGYTYSTSQAHPSPFSPQPEGGLATVGVVIPPPANDESFAPSGSGRGGVGAGGVTLSFDVILSDLEAAEAKAYEAAFNSFAGGAPVPLDNAQCREFLLTNGSFEDLEIDLLQVATETMTLDISGFLRLLRLRPLSEQDIYGQFSAFSADGTSLASEECRTGLMLMCQDKLAAHFSDEQWDRMLFMVLMDADPVISVDQWIEYAKKIARYVRLVQYCGS